MEYGREEELLALGNESIEHAKEILGLLGAVNLPHWITMVCLPVHWRGSSHSGWTAEEVMGWATRGLPLLWALIPHLDLSLWGRLRKSTTQ